MNEEISDWEELPEEDPPEKLQRKWDEEAYGEKRFSLCPACRKEVPTENLTCIFCGVPVNENTGLLGSLASGFKRLFWWGKRR